MTSGSESSRVTFGKNTWIHYPGVKTSPSRHALLRGELTGATKAFAEDLVEHQDLLAQRPPLVPDPQSFPFRLDIYSVENLQTDGTSKDEKGTEYSLRVSLFDATYKQFFGRTWVGPSMPAHLAGQRYKLAYNQSLYFHTALNDTSIMAVVEVVASTPSGGGKVKQSSCGWGLFRIFKYEGDMPDSAGNKAAPTFKMNLYHGSPRALLFIDEPVEESRSLNPVRECQIMYTIRTHRHLQKAMSLIPENVIMGSNEVIPGIMEGARDHETGIPDCLKKPRLVRSMPCFIEKISISINPTLEKFEEEICHLLNEDRINRENVDADGTSVSVLERRLRVGVHNGWCYVAEPAVVHLGLEAGVGGHKRLPSMRRGSAMGHRRSPSNGSLGSAGQCLVHKNRVQLEGMREDPGFAVVFVLEYVLGEPVAEKDRRMGIGKTQSYEVTVRWAAWSPFTHLDQTEQSVQLFGGPCTNPDSVFVFKSLTLEGSPSTESFSSLVAGAVNFNFETVKKSKESEPSVLAVPSPAMQRAESQLSVQSDDNMLRETQLSARPPLPTSARRHPGSSGPLAHSGEVPPLGMTPTPRSVHIQPPGYPSVGPHGTVYQPTPRGYYPIEISHISDVHTPAQSARLGTMGGELTELPFAPVHAPIMATAPGMHSGSSLSRAAYAQLATVGFPPILDRKGEAPEMVDPSDHINFVAAKEEADKLQTNEVVLQFLAFSRLFRSSTDTGHANQHGTVFFTFQFYRFPQVTTERLLLGQVQGNLSVDRHSLPCLLQKIDKDGSVQKGPPGYQVKYHVDPAYLKPGEGRLFAQHLSQQTLHIDVWDGDSLLLIGSCAVELKHLCRQGREGVQVTYELDVVSTEFVEQDLAVPAGDMTMDGAVKQTIDVSTILKGRLHLRMANVGHPSDSKVKGEVIPLPPKPRVIISEETSVGSLFTGGSLSSVNPHTASVIKNKQYKAKHMAQTNHELAAVLSTKQEKPTHMEESKREAEAARQRKLARMSAIRRKEGGEQYPLITTYHQEKTSRSRDLKTIEMYRSQNKREGILNMLNQAITTEHVIHPALGNTEFFEFQLKNPYNVDHTVMVEVSDPELFVITDPREWRHYKMLSEIYTSVEEGMFNENNKSGHPEIYLRPKETVSVPFKFLSFKGDHTVLPQGPSDPYRPQKPKPSYKDKTDPLASRLIKVYFKTQDNKPISILAVRVEPQPHVIDQTFRFHHPEQTFFKKSIRLPPLHSLPGVPVGGGGLAQINVRCSDPNVIAETKKVQQGEPHDVFLKVAVGPSPQTKRFFLALYTDAFLSKPFQVWQFYIHALQRVDVSCVEGQTSRFTLILRGTQASRLVQCFPSHDREMNLHPKEPFMLNGNSMQELHVGVRPLSVGTRYFFINVVDIEYHQLVRNWLVAVNCRAPLISKAFELVLPVGGGKGCNKRISYTNPYPSKKVFLLRSNRDDLVQFKEDRLEVGGGESANIGLRFAPSQVPGTVEILVFINDEDDKNEETFCVRAVYQ